MNAFHKARGREISCSLGSFDKPIQNAFECLCMFSELQGGYAGLLPEETDEE